MSKRLILNSILHYALFFANIFYPLLVMLVIVCLYSFCCNHRITGISKSKGKKSGNTRNTPKANKALRTPKVEKSSESKILWRYCEHCDYKAKTFKKLRHHLASEHKLLETFPCPKEGCQVIGHTSQEIQGHFHKTHENDPFPWKCTKCPKSFKLNCELNKHTINAHSEMKSFLCQYCSNSYRIFKSMQAHVKSKHPEKWNFPLRNRT